MSDYPAVAASGLMSLHDSLRPSHHTVCDVGPYWAHAVAELRFKWHSFRRDGKTESDVLLMRALGFVQMSFDLG